MSIYDRIVQGDTIPAVEQALGTYSSVENYLLRLYEEELQRRERARSGQLTTQEMLQLRRQGYILPGSPASRIVRSPVFRTLAPVASGVAAGLTFGVFGRPTMAQVYGEEAVEPTPAGRVLGTVAEVGAGFVSPVGRALSVMSSPITRGIGRTITGRLGRLLATSAAAGFEGVVYGLVTNLTDREQFERTREVLEKDGPVAAAADMARRAGIRGAEWAAFAPVAVWAADKVIRRLSRGLADAPAVVSPETDLAGAPRPKEGQQVVYQPGVANIFGQPAPRTNAAVEQILLPQLRAQKPTPPPLKGLVEDVPEAVRPLADVARDAVEVLRGATPEQLLALEFIRRSPPELLAKVLRGTRKSGTSPRQLGINPRNIQAVAEQYGVPIEEARRIVYAEAVRKLAQMQGKSVADLLKEETGQVTLGVLLPGGEAVRGHKEELRRVPGAHLLEALGAVVYEKFRARSSWSKQFMAMLKDINPDLAAEVEPRLDSLYKASAELLAGRKARAAGKLATVERLLEMYHKGYGGHEWYDPVKKVTDELLSPEDADVFRKLLALTSPQQNVRTNLKLAMKAFKQYLSGEPFSGFHPDQIEQMEKLLRQGADPKEVMGRKVWNFYRALSGDPNAVVIDMWVARAFNLPENVSDQDYDFMAAKVAQLAQQVGVTPRQFQAALWTGIRAEHIEKGLLRDENADTNFQDLLAKTPWFREQVEIIRKRNGQVTDIPQEWSTPNAIRESIFRDNYVIITPDNPAKPTTVKFYSGESNQAAFLRVLTEEYGVKASQVIPVVGRYGQLEQSYIIRGMPLDKAVELADRFGQEAIVINRGILTTSRGKRGRRDVWLHPFTGETKFGQDAINTDGYSIINTPSGQVAFRAEVDWDQAVPWDVKPEQLSLSDILKSEGGFLRLSWSGGRYVAENPAHQVIADQATERARGVVRRHILATGEPPKTMPDVVVDVKPDGSWSIRGIVDMAEEWATAVKLTLPLTHIRNTVSNVYGLLLRPLEAEVAGAISEALGRGTRFRGEGAQIVVGYASAWRGAAPRLIQALRNELTTQGAALNEEVLATTKLGERAGAIPGAVGLRVRTPFRLLALADDFFKQLHTEASIYQAAYRQARKEGLPGDKLVDRVAELVKNPTEDVKNYALKKAAEFTFTEDLGDFGRALMQLRDSVPGARFFLPFVKTPINVMKFFARRTPFGAVTGLKMDGNKVVAREGGEMEESLARAAVGSVIGSLFVWWAMEGNITGAGPENPALRRTLMASGWQPYSVRIGDKWVSYRGLEPLATFLAQAANIVETVKSAEDASDAAAKLARNIGRSVTDATFVNALSDLSNALENPEYYGTRYITDTVSSAIVPAIVSGIARTIDPTVRDPQNAVERMMTRIPGLREKVPAKIDVLGREVRTGGIALITPTITDATVNPVAAEAARLGIALPQPSKKKKKEEVPRGVWEARAKKRGELYRQLLSRLITTDAYKNLDDEAKRRVMERWIRSIVEVTSR